jgi:acyl transferase domain-containing protein/nucleoside-diphosphate-sugar epimerase/SAM-dependent methyltransferase/acyl carrier protein
MGQNTEGSGNQGTTVLVFGPQALSFNQQSLANLQKALSGGAVQQHKWILDTVAELPSYWAALTDKLPEIADAIPGEKLLADLQSSLGATPLDDRLDDGGNQGLQAQDDNLPNTVLTPLVVLTQLTEYMRYLELNQHGNGNGSGNGSTAWADPQTNLLNQVGSRPRKVETLGFCTGLLSAFAVASAQNQTEFEKYGAVALRLAMLIGALIDAHEARSRQLGHGASRSYATAWRNSRQAEEVTSIINGLFPDAYISVRYDETRATVTTSEQTAPALLQQLRAAGITVAEVGLRGYFHSPNSALHATADILIQLCQSMPDLQFQDASRLAMPTYTNEARGGRPIGSNDGGLHELAVRGILVQQCDWHGTFAAVQAAQVSHGGLTVLFGPERCIPPTLTRQLGPRLVHISDLDEDIAHRLASALDPDAHKSSLAQRDSSKYKFSGIDDDAIAIVGMSIKVAGADDVDEFSTMLRTGESQHEEIGPDRLMFDTLWREGDRDPKRKWYGNFIRDVDAFDHKFFKRSPRESATMDPQQRLFLEAAYQAVEQSGYFSETSSSPTETHGSKRDKRHVGVYLGACAGDYEHHAACHTANAFTATGNLKSFIPGKVSHYFGWTGPSMTFDTACSASAVAIHTACRNLLSGECSAALAGGVATMTNFLWFQNLAGASFLSPTGQCKAFDDAADGYCRAEGIACVFLKRLPDAVADGNPIFGCIASTAVYQNQNCTPLFVPNSPSLSQLFSDVVAKAGLTPRDISLVEAHGTGTPVGDPAEYESIRLALGGPRRDTVLPIGSVKGHIGHTEGASGVISLIKVIVMMQDNFIPKQASFSRMSRHIAVSPTDMMEVVTSLRPWAGAGAAPRAALINNYGASGSNASMVVVESPYGAPSAASRSVESGGNTSFPFWIAGQDAKSITAYCAKLATFLMTRQETGNMPTLADMSFNMGRQSNRSLARGLMFACHSMAQLREQLAGIIANPDAAADADILPVKPERPVILCFGGQVSTFVGLDRRLYDAVALLRHHLDRCEAVMRSLGLESLYPDIFSTAPVGDTVKLQTMLFAMQYASAQCWLDSGLAGKVVAAVGHSFGEITALCVTGALGLKDTVKLVAARARLIRDEWGPDPGAMMAVEADEAVVHQLLDDANRIYAGGAGSSGSATIACYNGPRSFTLAGSAQAIDAVAERIPSFASAIRSKRLNVTNAFHSTLVDPLGDRLDEVARQLHLRFRDPSIPLEYAVENRPAPGTTNTRLAPSFMREHMRSPVYFNHAVQRLARDHPSAVWLEAGSASTITVMASRALAATIPGGSHSLHHFQALSLTTTDKGLDGLADATLSLWRQGVRVTFWPHHALQTPDYTPLLLPPYQFERARHWLELKSPLKAVADAAATLAATQPHSLAQQNTQDERSLGLWTFAGYQVDKGKKAPRFRINTGSDKYKSYISGHIIAQTAPICPATLQVDMAIEALSSLHPTWAATGHQPVVLDMANHSPLCVDPTRAVWLEFEVIDDNNNNNNNNGNAQDDDDDDALLWSWKIVSTPLTGGGGSEPPQVHVLARLHIRPCDDAAYQAEFARFERLVSHAQCVALLNRVGDNHGDEEEASGVEILQGRNLYRAFSEIVDYGELYRGLRRVVGRPGECAGRVQKRHGGETWLDVPLSDSFSQVGGLWANCMTDRGPGDMYIATGCEVSMRSPRMARLDKAEWPDVWHVLARVHRQTEKLYVADVFVFNGVSGMLTEVMLGIQYARVAKASMSKMLTRLTNDDSVLRVSKAAPSTQNMVKTEADVAVPSAAPAPPPAASNAAESVKKAKPSRPDITDDVRKLVAHVSGVEAHEITLDCEMADLGIDSLMGMEVAREVESVFKCHLDQAELMEATSLRKFIVCISHALYGPDGASDSPGEATPGSTSSDDDESDHSHDSSLPSSAASSTTWSEPSSSKSFTVLKPAPAAVAPAAAAGDPPAQTSNLSLDRSDVLECFAAVKMNSDKDIRRFNLDNIDRTIIAASNRLSTALVVEQFELLGCHLRAAAPGQVLPRVPFQPQHKRLMEFVYGFLERDARLIDIDHTTGQVTRTAIAPPRKASEVILQELLQAYPEFRVANRLTGYAGKHLADVLSGKSDGIRVIFGSVQGRELVQALYCEHTFNRMNYGQMRDVIERLAARLPRNQGPLKILEMGAGTGGTTYVLAPFLASLDLPVEYTFTDLSPSMVANARRKFGKEYPFMRFAVHDIEKAPVAELCGQHIVIASNAIHATHNLAASTANVRTALRPDGFLMMLEMTESAPFIDLIFGLLEGWWLFDDGRQHAIVPAEHWEHDLHDAGFGHVDWTDGSLPENVFQKVMIAMASGPKQARLPKPGPEVAPQTISHQAKPDYAAREAEAEKYIAQHIAGFTAPVPSTSLTAEALRDGKDAVVLVTGATGSLGSHLAAALASNPAVKSVVCLNRRSSSATGPQRQATAFSSRGITLPPSASAKLRVLATDASGPALGLSPDEYTSLVHSVTHIVHNAWPMSGTRPLKAFDAQFATLRGLLNLARDIACHRANSAANPHFRVGFQLVSSIGVVGHAGVGRVPEDRVGLRAVLPIGYCEAKWVCERMVDETLHRGESARRFFRPMVVRPGQIAGSRESGVWNPVEHFAFLVKSAQALRAWPNFDGVLQWVPVNDVAAAMVDLLRVEDLGGGGVPVPEAYPVYHIDNPVGQPWKEMSPVLARELGVPGERVVPFREWVTLVRRSPLPAETDNPAARLIDFLDQNFERMSCGGLILDTTKAKEHSPTMAALGPVSAEVARCYVAAWKKMGWLHA